MNKKIAIITGASGQDASYLAEFLLNKEYKVLSINRRTSTNNTERLINCLGNSKFNIIEGDVTDSSSINNIINRYKPDEFYNLASQSHVATSYDQPICTLDINAKGSLFALEAIRYHSPHTKYYQASTSEMFGGNYTTKYVDNIELKFQNEQTALSPNSPYAVAKVAAHHFVRIYRDSYKIFACSGILFNHESERRGENFVTRKITKYIGQLIASNLRNIDKLKLGNIEAVRDWGHSRDYVESMWMMLQQDKPDDYVIGTGEGHSVKEFLIEAFSIAGLKWEDFVEIDSSLYRPCEVSYLRCDASKAFKILGWKPKVAFKELVKLMVESDVNFLSFPKNQL